MRAWWQTFEARERTAIVLGGVVLLVTLGYVALWAPLEAERARQQERRAALTADLLWMREARDAVAALRASRGPGAGAGSEGRSLLSRVDLSTRAVGVAGAVSDIAPEDEGRRVAVTLEAVRFDTLMRWLGRLQGHDIRVRTLALERIGDSPDVRGRVLLGEGPG